MLSAPHESKSSNNFFLNTDTRCFEKDTCTCVLNFLAENCVVSSFPASFASGHKNIWNLGILSSRDPSSPRRAGPHSWVVCPGATSKIEFITGSWSDQLWSLGTPAHGEVQPLGWVQSTEHGKSGISAGTDCVGRVIKFLQNQLLGLLHLLSIIF